MQVTLYKYIGDSDTANKLLRDCTVIYNKEVIPYGAFNPNGASFRLDTLHDVNYAKFTYNGHDYYGYVDVSTDSKGLYNYSITTDPLTTAWYAGCFNSSNICKYSDYGTLLIEDPRATVKSEYEWSVITYNPFNPVLTSQDDWFIVTILSPQISNSATHINNPIFQSYAMQSSAYIKFVNEFIQWNDIDQKKYAPSIIGIYEVRGYENHSFTAHTVTQSIELWNMADNGKISSKTITINDANIYRCDLEYSGQTPWNSYSSYDIELNEEIVATSNNLNTQFQLHIPDCGDIKFSLKGILTGKMYESQEGYTIYSIGYVKQYDFVSGTCRAYLVLNRTAGSGFIEMHPEYSLTSTLPLRVPFMYDASVQDWRAARQAVITSGIGLFTDVLKGVGAVATTVATGGAAAPVAAMAGTKAVSSTISHLNEVSSFKHLEWIDENSTASTISGIGGSSDFTDLPWCLGKTYKTHNIGDIQAKFGKPDGLARIIANMTGWVQTEVCHLPSNGLPFDIVTQAEQLANQGFRIVT